MLNKNYPHPVLSKERDDFDKRKAYFDIKIFSKTEGNYYRLNCQVKLKERVIEDLIKQGNAKFVIRVHCNRTRFRKVFEFSELQEEIILPASSLDSKIEISTYIVAKKKIESYTSLSFHSDYEDISFIILPGDVLAEGPEYSMDVEKEIDKLVKLPSIFTIILDQAKTAPSMNVDSGGDKIVVRLNKINFEKYKQLKQMQEQYGNLAPLTSSLFITPALVMVLENIRLDIEKEGYNSDDLQGYVDEKIQEHRWFNVIHRKLKEQGKGFTHPDLFIDGSIVIAQKLLGEPLTQGLDFFEELLTENVEEEL